MRVTPLCVRPRRRGFDTSFDKTHGRKQERTMGAVHQPGRIKGASNVVNLNWDKERPSVS